MRLRHPTVATRLLAFQDHYQQIAQPFEWRFTRADLDRILARLEPQPLAKAA